MSVAVVDVSGVVVVVAVVDVSGGVVVFVSGACIVCFGLEPVEHIDFGRRNKFELKWA